MVRWEFPEATTHWAVLCNPRGFVSPASPSTGLLGPGLSQLGYAAHGCRLGSSPGKWGVVSKGSYSERARWLLETHNVQPQSAILGLWFGVHLGGFSSGCGSPSKNGPRRWEVVELTLSQCPSRTLQELGSFKQEMHQRLWPLRSAGPMALCKSIILAWASWANSTWLPTACLPTSPGAVSIHCSLLLCFLF